MGLGLYVHVPFCQAKCSYCDFISYAGREDFFVPYEKALISEIELIRRRLDLTPSAEGECSHSLYLGGGTPTVLPSSALKAILDSARHHFSLDPDGEITIEANPGTLSSSYLAELRDMGISRISLGVQSFREAELRLLGRIHDRRQALEAIRWSRAAGFCSMSVDLIYGLPGQRLSDWQETLRVAIGQGPDHLSLYALTLEAGTPLTRRVAAGALAAPDEDLVAEMYLVADEQLLRAGYYAYEISNWAQPGFESQHNRNYWLNGPYLGFGPAAHSHIGLRRWWNVETLEEYSAILERGEMPMAGDELLDLYLDMAETVILGLRLVSEGLHTLRFAKRYGRSVREVYGPELEHLVEEGLVLQDDEKIRLTQRGRLLGNQVFMRFLPPHKPAHR